jgi:hypothetical protein
MCVCVITKKINNIYIFIVIYNKKKRKVLPMLLRESYEDDMKWANETRRCAVMFVNLGLEEHNMLAAGDVRQRDAMMQVCNRNMCV